jgi:hypothetical protein
MLTCVVGFGVMCSRKVVDFCFVNYSPDRHPMHMHAQCFWPLGAGINWPNETAFCKPDPAVRYKQPFGGVDEHWTLGPLLLSRLIVLLHVT